MYFYPRSPCGERPASGFFIGSRSQFLSTLSLRRATSDKWQFKRYINISIHALLAESDFRNSCRSFLISNFYPRSPCGERHLTNYHFTLLFIFLSTLSLRRATGCGQYCIRAQGISIHALLAESDGLKFCNRNGRANFYPRSPCGERRYLISARYTSKEISIHALLAESDHPKTSSHPRNRISIHALLAESDSKSAQNSRALLRI